MSMLNTVKSYFSSSIVSSIVFLITQTLTAYPRSAQPYSGERLISSSLNQVSAPDNHLNVGFRESDHWRKNIFNMKVLQLIPLSSTLQSKETRIKDEYESKTR